MTTHTITVADEQQYQKLLALAQQAGIEVIADGLAVLPAPPLPDLSHLSREEKLAILRRGGSGTSIPDPLAWQRAERAGWDERLAFPQS
ncbi:MAG: hypothetical protein M3Y54_19190 [Bacteroidota bacterium]|nr:hypothetical protein [Bacteroidota bacterium]